MNLVKEIGTRSAVLLGLLCLFSVFYVLGCIAVTRTALMGDYVG